MESIISNVPLGANIPEVNGRGVNLRQDREFHVASASGLEDCQGSIAHSGPVRASL